MSNSSLPTQASEKNNIATYVHDAYELEKKIYAMNELKSSLINGKDDFKQKEFNKLPQKPQSIQLKPELHYQREFVQNDLDMWIKKEIQENNKIKDSLKNYASFKMEVATPLLIGVIACIPGAFLIGYIFENIWHSITKKWFVESEAITTLIIIGMIILLLPITISFVIGICSFVSDKRMQSQMLKKLPTDNIIITQTRNKFEKENKAVRERNQKAFYENEKISKYNNALKKHNQQILNQYEIEYKKAYNTYQLSCTAYTLQIEKISNALSELYQIRDKMYALDIIPPDYCELKHLHYFDHYFKNRLVDNIRDAVIMYRQEAFQEMMELSLGNIISGINSLTGEVRQLGMSLRKIQADIGLISSELSKSTLLQEEILSTVQDGFEEMQYSNYSLIKETRAQRYAAEAIKESTSRLAWYEQQRYYGYM